MAKRQPLIYAVAHLKGGSGKTSTAIHMAVLLSERGRKVLYLDADIKGSFSGAKFLQRREESRPDDQPEIKFAHLKRKDQLLGFIEECERTGTDLVIDTSPVVTDLFVGVLALAHIAVHPIRQGHIDLDSVPNLQKLLSMVQPIRQKNGIPPLKSRSLVTDFSPTKQGRAMRDYLEAGASMRYLGEIPHSEKFGEALVSGHAIWEYTKRHQHNAQIREVILGCIEK